MKQNERTALALVRSGRSFDEAAESAGIPVARVMEIWGVQMRTTQAPASANERGN